MKALRRLLVLLTAACLAALTVSVAPASVGGDALLSTTEAAWLDAQYAEGPVEAGTLDVPTITVCTTENEGTNGAMSGVTIGWTSELDDPARMLATFAIGAGASFEAPTDRIQVTGPAAGLYTYTVTVTATELEGALGPLAGASVGVAVSTRAGTEWRSAPASRTVAIGTLGGGRGSATCDLGHTLTLTGLIATTPPISRVIPVGTSATSSLPPALQDRRRTPVYTATVRDITTNALVPNTAVTIVLPDGLAFESGPFADLSEGTFTTSATGTVEFRVVGNRSEPAQGPVRVESPRAFTILSAQPVTSVPLVAWGYSAQGQTGSDDLSVARTSAVPLWDNLSITGATAIGSSYSTLLYADQNGNLWGRGYNASGIIGDGTTTSRSTVVAALTGPGAQLGGITYIGTGTDQLSSTAVDASGGVWATGDNELSGFGTGYTNTRYWQRVSDNYTMPSGALTAEVNPYGAVLMVLENGQAMVAGADSYGYSAQGSAVSAAAGSTGLVMLTGPSTPITGVVSGGIGWHSSAVVTQDGRLFTAGTAAYGGSGTFYLVEKALPAGKTAAKVIVRQYRMLVIMTDGSVYALGANTSSSQGIGSSATPGTTLTAVAMPAGSVVTDVAMANDTTLFLLNTGAVYFAGLNDTGGAGVGNTAGTFSTPVRVPLAHTATKIAASWYDTYLTVLG
ncbi:RCC1 domain-containing protein [Microbacterium sp. NPDC055665]